MNKKTRQIAKKLSGTLSRILYEFSRDYDKRLISGIQSRGHPEIRQSHQIVFANIGLGRARVTELATRAQVTQQAMGKTLKELEKLNYVERAIDSTDRRAKAIRLTDRGMDLLAVAVDVADEVHSYYGARVGKQQLMELDAKLRDAAGKLELDYLPPFWAELDDSN